MIVSFGRTVEKGWGQFWEGGGGPEGIPGGGALAMEKVLPPSREDSSKPFPRH